LTIIELPGPCGAAAADGETVWCVAGGRFLRFDGNGRPRVNTPIAPGVRSVGAVGSTVAATLDPGVVAWLDSSSGKALRQRPASGDAVLVTGGGSIWAVDARTGRAWRLGEPGTLIGPLAVPGVDRAAADGDRLWWTSRHDSTLRGGARPVDLGVAPHERGGLAACAGSIWISITRGLIRVGAWAAEKGLPVLAPTGPVEFLACSGGVLVGGSERGLFALDPAADADARLIEANVGGDVGLLVATSTTVWMFPARRREARLVKFHTA
jgi:hypothetical protein